MEDEKIKRDIEANFQFKQMLEKSREYGVEEKEAIDEKQHDIVMAFMFAKQSGEEYSSDNVQRIVAVLIDFITDFYYDCDSKALLSLAEAFVVKTDYNDMLNQVEENITDYIYNAIVYYYNSHS